MTGKVRLNRLRRAHRLLGLLGGLSLLWLATTGLLLIYADELKLAKTAVPALVTRAYGLGSGVPPLTVAGHRLDFDGAWHFDDKPLEVTLHAPAQLLPGPGDLYYAIADDGAALLTRDGTLVEVLSAASLGVARLSRAGGNEDLVCLGDEILRCTRDGATWLAPSDALPHLQPVAPAAAAVSIERLVLDIHAGRVTGPFRKPIATAFALILLILPWTGLRLAVLGRQARKDSQ
jgi:hypothetical protein